MKKEIAERIGKSLNQHQEAKHKAAEVRDQRVAEEDQFVREFYKVRDEIVKPAMEAIAAMVEEKGYPCDIKAKDAQTELSSSLPASIEIIINRDPKRGQQQPHLEVICDKVQRKVRFHESTLGSGGMGTAHDVGEVTLDEISEDLIQEKLADLISKPLD
jgi:hypothetical protein